MKDLKLSGHPLMDLIIYHGRAISDEHWLEAIVLAHMFIETQLRISLGLDQVRKTRTTQRDEKVIKLAERALKEKIIALPLFRKIEEFNTARNDGAHNLSFGIITYAQLEQMARQSDDLISELQELYAHVELGPEIRIE